MRRGKKEATSGWLCSRATRGGRPPALCPSAAGPVPASPSPPLTGWACLHNWPQAPGPSCWLFLFSQVMMRLPSPLLLPLPASACGLGSRWRMSSETRVGELWLAFPVTSETSLSAPSLDVPASSLKASAALSVVVPRPPTPFLRSRSRVWLLCALSVWRPRGACVSTTSWKVSLSHSYHIPAAQPSVNPQIHGPGISALAALPRCPGSLFCFHVP